MRKLFLLPLFLFVACKPLCTAEDVIVKNLAPLVASSLQCSNVGTIQADIQSIIDKNHVCSSVTGEKQGAVAMIVCPIVAKSAVDLIGSQVPATWGCNPVSAKQGLSAAITAACNLLPF